jgi:hypothetical protein
MAQSGAQAGLKYPSATALIFWLNKLTCSFSWARFSALNLPSYCYYTAWPCAQQLLNYFEVNVFRQQDRSRGLPEIVKANFRQTGFFKFGLEVSDQVAGSNRRANLGGKEQARLFPVGSLSQLIPPVQVDF